MEIMILYFLLSVFFTFLFLYMTSQKIQPMLKYPSHKDKVSKLYIDDNNVCYRYHTKEVKCKKYM